MNEPALDGMVETALDRADPLFRKGNTNCGGCGMSLTLQMLRHAVAERPVHLVIPASCAAVAGGTFPQSTFGVPTLMTTFASAPAAASGVASVAALNGEDLRAIILAGDGGTFDIGFASLSAAAERNEDILYICYDNEIYGNTGGQRSSATPAGAVTTNTPDGKVEQKKDILAILVFLERMELDSNNGRRRGRAFLDFLRQSYPAAAATPPGPAFSPLAIS